jgi:7,8-dihydropterin-6-yl-methyl-4-(beta-D-ribofuranosyl)aminobenzene 5'-phosphate synthase
VIFSKDIAAHYEAWYETPEGRRADELEKDVLGWLLQEFAQTGSVLEIGCGTAHFTRWLNDLGLAAVGLDLSAAMLTQARTLDSVPLVRGDAYRLPFADGAFDLATLVTTLEFLEQPREALAEALRVARSGLVLGVLNRWSLLGLQRRLAGIFRPTVYDAARFYGVGKLKRLIQLIAGEQARVEWRTTLFPPCWPWPQARLPWGGFIGTAVIVRARSGPVAPDFPAAPPAGIDRWRAVVASRGKIERSTAMKITTIYDNKTLDPNLASAWGFACLVSDDLLFDTGGDARRLLSNMEKMGIDPAGIKTVVLSHAHGDHTGGLGGLLNTGARPAVYVPRSFPRGIKADVRAITKLVEVEGPVEIRPGIHTTGEVGSRLVEQALAVETASGTVVVTGCAHPGIVELVRRAKESVGGEVALVLGGFHLGSTRRRKVERIIADFRDLGVRQVAPCHCTGDRAIRAFAEEYGDDFVKVGAGLVLTVGSEEQSEISSH